MIVHVMRFSFKDDVGAEERERFLAGLRRVVAVDDVAFSVVGVDLAGDPDGYTHAYSTAFEDLAAFDRYLDDPAQRELVMSSLALISKIATVDYSDENDPTLGERYQERHRQFVESLSYTEAAAGMGLSEDEAKARVADALAAGEDTLDR